MTLNSIVYHQVEGLQGRGVQRILSALPPGQLREFGGEFSAAFSEDANTVGPDEERGINLAKFTNLGSVTMRNLRTEDLDGLEAMLSSWRPSDVPLRRLRLLVGENNALWEMLVHGAGREGARRLARIVENSHTSACLHFMSWTMVYSRHLRLSSHAPYECGIMYISITLRFCGKARANVANGEGALFDDIEGRAPEDSSTCVECWRYRVSLSNTNILFLTLHRIRPSQQGRRCTIGYSPLRPDVHSCELS